MILDEIILPSSFNTKVNKIIKQDNKNLFLLLSTSDNKETWFYIRITNNSKFIILNNLATSKKEVNIDLQDYGEIIYRGWGKEPPYIVKSKIKKMTGDK